MDFIYCIYASFSRSWASSGFMDFTCCWSHGRHIFWHVLTTLSILCLCHAVVLCRCDIYCMSVRPREKDPSSSLFLRFLFFPCSSFFFKFYLTSLEGLRCQSLVSPAATYSNGILGYINKIWQTDWLNPHNVHDVIAWQLTEIVKSNRNIAHGNVTTVLFWTFLLC